jgi:hypothetical protein
MRTGSAPHIASGDTWWSPVPTQIVSSDEYFPEPQTRDQKRVEARLIEMADSISKKQGLSRRRFFQSASGMAASFVAMNAVYGEFFDATPVEAQTPELADNRAKKTLGPVHYGHSHSLSAR